MHRKYGTNHGLKTHSKCIHTQVDKEMYKKFKYKELAEKQYIIIRKVRYASVK